MPSSERADLEHALTGTLERVRQAGKILDFWWRDDDAVSQTAALDRLLGQADRFGVPLVLAVIPEPAEPGLFSRIADTGGVTVSQHGFAHRNHEPPSEKKTELGAARAADLVLDELARGRDILTERAGSLFAPILTPPWNRIAPDIAERRIEIGLTGLSTYGPTGADPHQVNTHVDMIDWHGGRGFIGWDRVTAMLQKEIDRRLAGRNEPIGLLTHHLVHDEETWAFLDAFLSLTSDHPAARWQDPPTLFGLTAETLPD
ncbi:MAG: polysaccharide deacetylase family protein [Pseudomonadota bacterium]